MTTAFHKSWKDYFSQSQLVSFLVAVLQRWINALRQICSMLDRTSWWKTNVSGRTALERHSLSSSAKSWNGPNLPVWHPSRARMFAGTHVPQRRWTGFWSGLLWSQHYCFSVALVFYSRMELLVLPCHLYITHLQLWELHSSPWLRMFYSWSIYGKTKHRELWWCWISFSC